MWTSTSLECVQRLLEIWVDSVCKCRPVSGPRVAHADGVWNCVPSELDGSMGSSKWTQEGRKQWQELHDTVPIQMQRMVTSIPRVAGKAVRRDGEPPTTSFFQISCDSLSTPRSTTHATSKPPQFFVWMGSAS